MQTVIGLFENAQDAQEAVQKLISKGFSSDNVDVSVRDRNSDSYTSSHDTYGDSISGSGNLSGSSTDTGSRSRTYDGDDADRDSYISHDYTTGSDTDRRRTGDNDDSFGDKVSKFFKKLFGSDDDQDSDRYVRVASTTGCIVTVHAQDRDEAERAADILDDNGAIDVNEKASQYGYSGTDTDQSSYQDTYTGDRDLSGTLSGESDIRDRRDDDEFENKTMNVIKEDVHIGKREVERGGVRLRSRIVERPVQEELRLREETVRVERNTVDRPAESSDIRNFKEGEIEITEYAEVPEVKKDARVVEEVTISKDVDERTEKINTTALDTEVDVEKIPGKERNRRDSDDVR